MQNNSIVPLVRYCLEMEPTTSLSGGKLVSQLLWRAYGLGGPSHSLSAQAKLAHPAHPPALQSPLLSMLLILIYSTYHGLAFYRILILCVYLLSHLNRA